MDESLLVSFINQGSFQPLTLERIFYVDSLVMLSLNILLLTGLFRLIKKHIFNPKMSMYMLLGGNLIHGDFIHKNPTLQCLSRSTR